MIEEEKFIHFLKFPPRGYDGFSISKNYLIDISRRKVKDIRDGSELDYSTESKILIYEDRQKTWFFDVAEYLRIKNKVSLPDNSEFDTNEAGFVILMIAVSYLESNQKYVAGSENDTSSNRIRDALDRIFPMMTNTEKNIFVDGVRCGLFHDGITKKGIFISVDQTGVYVSNVDQRQLIVNPHKFLEAVMDDFQKYIQKLKNLQNVDERTKFETMWDSQKGI